MSLRFGGAFSIVKRARPFQLAPAFFTLANLHERASQLIVSVGDGVIEEDGGAQLYDGALCVAGLRERAAQCEARVEFVRVSACGGFQ
jgi:hypothetical protein